MDLKELIKSFNKEDFGNIVNLHIHTTCSDGNAKVDEILNQAKSQNFKYISITDHNTLDAYKNINLEQENFVITGVEFDCWFKTTFIHLLGYGINIKSPELTPFLAKTKKETEANIVRIFSTRNVKKLINAIHNAGGIAVLAHPACYWCFNLDNTVKKLVKIGLDGIEVYYPYGNLRGIVKFHSRKTVEKIAEKYNLIKTGGTDCHENLKKKQISL